MSKFWDKEEVIAEIEKNKSSKVVVTKCERQGKVYIDYRIYIEKADKDNEFIPSSKGFTLEIDKFKELNEKVINKI